MINTFRFYFSRSLPQKKEEKGKSTAMTFIEETLYYSADGPKTAKQSEPDSKLEVLILSLAYSVTLVKSLHLSEPLFPPVLQNENNKT